MSTDYKVLAERDPAVRVLIDETDLHAGFVGPQDVRPDRAGVAERKRAPLRPIAAFASNPVIYGLNRMLQGLAIGAERVTVFHDRARARDWLLEG